MGDVDRAWLIEPPDYLDFTHLMNCVDLVVTDSGGIQEEAPALGKPVLVIRRTAERPEAVEAGTARLVGTGRESLVTAVSTLLDDPIEYDRMRRAINPYGDGRAAERIVDGARNFFWPHEDSSATLSAGPDTSATQAVCLERACA